MERVALVVVGLGVCSESDDDDDGAMIRGVTVNDECVCRIEEKALAVEKRRNRGMTCLIIVVAC